MPEHIPGSPRDHGFRQGDFAPTAASLFWAGITPSIREWLGRGQNRSPSRCSGRLAPLPGNPNPWKGPPRPRAAPDMNRRRRQRLPCRSGHPRVSGPLKPAEKFAGYHTRFRVSTSPARVPIRWPESPECPARTRQGHAQGLPQAGQRKPDRAGEGRGGHRQYSRRPLRQGEFREKPMRRDGRATVQVTVSAPIGGSSVLIESHL